MSDDPTLDFLASGGVEAAPSSGDSTLDFLTSGGEYHTAPADTRSGSEIVADTEAQTAKSLGAGAEVGLHSTSSKVAGFLGHNAQGGDYPEVRQALTYQPKSEEGQQLQGVVDKAHETINYPGTWVAKHAGSPELGFAPTSPCRQPPLSRLEHWRTGRLLQKARRPSATRSCPTPATPDMSYPPLPQNPLC